MRPSRVDTSEPACTKRKMLSTNSSTSWFCTSRKYSAIGEGRQRDPQAHARRLVHLAEDEGGLVEHAGLRHLDAEVGALTGALADAGEHRHTTVVLGDAADHLGDEHGLAHAGAAEQADLAALQVGREQVDDLDAGLEHLLAGGSSVSKRRRVAVDVPALEARRTAAGSASSGSPHTLKMWPSTSSPTGTWRPWPVLRTGGAAGQAVGGLHADGPHPAARRVCCATSASTVGRARPRRRSSSRGRG